MNKIQLSINIIIVSTADKIIKNTKQLEERHIVAWLSNFLGLRGEHLSRKLTSLFGFQFLLARRYWFLDSPEIIIQALLPFIHFLDGLTYSFDTLPIHLEHKLCFHFSGESVESYSNLKNNAQKAESEKRQMENQVQIFKHEKQILEKSMREEEEEKDGLREQVNNLQRLLARAEDEKEQR